MNNLSVFESSGRESDIVESSRKLDDVMGSVQKSENKSNILSEEARILLGEYEKGIQDEQDRASDSYIKVSEVLGSVAFIYERIRNAVDYKGEHLLRRNAIERILRRRIWEKRDENAEDTVEVLIRELIWSKYLKNNSVPKRKVLEIHRIISKYKRLFHLSENGKNTPNVKSRELKDWFMEIASSEIEETLDPDFYFREALCKSLYFWFHGNFIWQDEGVSEDDKDVQIFIAIQRSFNKADYPLLRYALLKVYYPQWSGVSERRVDEIFPIVIEIRGEIERHLSTVIQPRMYRFVQKQTPAFLILKEALDGSKDNPNDLLMNSQKLEKKIREICNKKYEEIRKKVNTGIKRSIIYIFATKIIFAFLIEIPYELIFVEKLNFLSLSINITLPPILMFLVGLSIRKPGEENTQRIINKIKSFIYNRDGNEKVSFSLLPKKRNRVLSQVFIFFYALVFLLVFGGISYLLLLAGFNLISAGIFFGFLSLVLLFSYRVRYTAGELNVTGEREGIISHLFTNISLPFLNLGVWLSSGLSKLNFMLVIMDFLIESPLKNIIAVFEEWTSFIREKREEVVEVPN